MGWRTGRRTPQPEIVGENFGALLLRPNPQALQTADAKKKIISQGNELGGGTPDPDPVTALGQGGARRKDRTRIS